MGGYSSLKSLRVQGNKITGDLPSGLLTISTLEEVDISDNRFDGTLDVLFDGSNISPAGLKTFNADDNWLTGPIPLAFGFLPSLESLQLQDNQFKESESLEGVCNVNTVFVENGQFIVDCVLSCSCCVQANC
jgi:Leucine-rich repeat (LRR) protein